MCFIFTVFEYRKKMIKYLITYHVILAVFPQSNKTYTYNI